MYVNYFSIKLEKNKEQGEKKLKKKKEEEISKERVNKEKHQNGMVLQCLWNLELGKTRGIQAPGHM